MLIFWDEPQRPKSKSQCYRSFKRTTSSQRAALWISTGRGNQKAKAIFSHRRDIVGLRIALYFPGQQHKVVEIIQGAFECINHRKPKGDRHIEQAEAGIQLYQKDLKGITNSITVPSFGLRIGKTRGHTVKNCSRSNFAPLSWILGTSSSMSLSTKP